MTIEQQEFAFGAIYIGASAQQTLTLTNSSGIPAALLLDLSGHPEFRLELPAPVRARAASAAAPPEEDFADGPLQLISPGGPRSIDVEAESGDSATGEIDDEGPQYKILLAAKKTLTFVLTFLPTRDRVESFDLPLSILGVPADEQPARAVRARGLKPRARLAPPVLAFGAKIVKKETVKQIPYAMETVFTNTDEKPLTWQLGTADVDASKGVFTVEPKQGVLAEGASTTIRVTFLPREAEQYKCSVPVHLDGTTEKEPYSFLTLKGTGLAPGLAFEVREITLPVVPLGIRSCARFYLVNKGYDNLDVKYRLPIDSEKAPLQLEFPEGTLIGFAKERLPVDVSFASDQPLSFTANLDFFDDDGRKFSVPVTGTADNCLLTNHPFLTFNKDALQISVEDGKAPTLVPDAGYKIQPPELSDASVTSQSGALARWLDVTLARAPIRDVAGEFSASKGKLLIELVENLSGKGVPGKLGKLPPNKKDQAEAVRGQYEKVLTFLKQQGALLNAVKPELLLAEEDFERVLASREQGLEGSGDEVEGEGAAAAGAREAAAAWRAVQANFANVSREAWHMTLFQVSSLYLSFSFVMDQSQP